jgi:hypothetical protein
MSDEQAAGEEYGRIKLMRVNGKIKSSTLHTQAYTRLFFSDKFVNSFFTRYQ